MAELHAKPIRRYGFPAYPTKLQILAHPDLLQRHVPRAWLSRSEMARALTLFLAANSSGCTERPAPGGATSENAESTTAAIVAPIFEHGEGRGAVGCIVVSPPVFLSEEEAIQVIREELGRHGLHLRQSNVVLPEVWIPRRHILVRHDSKENRLEEAIVKSPENGSPLSVDLYDPERRIAVEYVSCSDLRDLGRPEYGLSTVASFGLKDVAKSVAARVQKDARGVHFAAFYDPLCRSSPAIDWISHVAGTPRRQSWEEAMQSAELESKRLLRQQVKDFVDWLAAQGVI